MQLARNFRAFFESHGFLLAFLGATATCPAMGAGRFGFLSHRLLTHEFAPFFFNDPLPLLCFHVESLNKCSYLWPVGTRQKLGFRAANE